jgi:hypothetical protein
MPPVFTWYEVIESADLQQGDFLPDCIQPLPPQIVGHATGTAVAEPVDEYPWVAVLTQSCDLANDTVDRVMVCPLYTLDEFLEMSGGGNKSSKKADLRKGRMVHFHLLNKCDLAGVEFSFMVADFSQAFSIPREYATERATARKRPRLLPPYREHMAQAFAKVFMRIGLPIDIDLP